LAPAASAITHCQIAGVLMKPRILLVNVHDDGAGARRDGGFDSAHVRKKIAGSLDTDHAAGMVGNVEKVLGEVRHEHDCLISRVKDRFQDDIAGAGGTYGREYMVSGELQAGHPAQGIHHLDGRTSVALATNPSCSRALMARGTSETIMRRMPKRWGSASERARKSTPAWANRRQGTMTCPGLFSTKTESCWIFIVTACR
jgi:hypothetical protein